jgi:hypothetical protein
VFAFNDSITAAWHYYTTDDIIAIPASLVASDSTVSTLCNYNHHWVHTYDTRTGALLSESIQYGQGPDEIVFGFRHGITKPNEQLYVFDLSTRCIKIFNDETRAEKIVNLNNAFGSVWDAWMLPNNKVLVKAPSASQHDDCVTRSLYVYDYTDEKILSAFDSIPTRVKSDPQVLATQAVGAVSPDGKHFAIGSTMQHILEFFSINADSLETTAIGCSDPENVASPSQPANTYWFTAMTADDSYIYAAYSGSTTPDAVTTIGVWDWTGKPIKKICSDATILKIAIAPNGRKLYAVVVPPNDNPKLSYLDLKHYL